MEERESERQQMSAVLSGGAPLARAVALARTFGEQLGLARDDLARLCIVAEELAANLSDHGTDPADAPQLSLSLEPGFIRLVMIDRGAPFDPRGADIADERRDRSGGAGLRLVRAWSEITNYTSSGGRNRLELILPLDGAGGTDGRCSSDVESGETG